MDDSLEEIEEIKSYCQNVQEIQEYTLNYLNDQNSANDQNNLTKLIQVLEKQNIIENEETFGQFLRMISKIGLYHRHINNFYPKINRIILEYKNFIKTNYSNEDIFSIFLHNEPILLFLLKEKIFQFDDEIKFLLVNKDYQEQQNFFFSADINEKYQEEGQNHTQICQIIRSDELQSFISYIEQNNVQLRSNISPSIYETNLFLRNHKETSLIQYSAFYGSFQIFKYMVENQPDILDETVWEFAFYGENKQIIDNIENHNIPISNKTIRSCIMNSIRSHQNDTFEKLLNRFLTEKNEEKEKEEINQIITKYDMLKSAILAFNYKVIAEYIEKVKKSLYNIFLKGCKSGLHQIVESLLFLPNLNINNCSSHAGLHYACMNGDLYLVKLLLAMPIIDINITSHHCIMSIEKEFEGFTPLELAIRYGHNRIVLLLLSNEKININKGSQWIKSLPLSVAVKFNNFFAAKVLLSFDGIQINSATNDRFLAKENRIVDGGETALHIACQYNRVEFVKLLLKHPNIDINPTNWVDKKPIDLTDNEEIKSLLNTPFSHHLAE